MLFRASLKHMEVPKLGGESELRLPAYTTAIATPDLNHVCDLHRSSWQCQILNPQSEARVWTQVLMDISQLVAAEPRWERPHFFFFFFIPNPGNGLAFPGSSRDVTEPSIPPEQTYHSQRGRSGACRVRTWTRSSASPVGCSWLSTTGASISKSGSGVGHFLSFQSLG